jgi:magnesium transporter
MTFRKRKSLLPESPVYVGDRPASEMDLSVITYDLSSAQMTRLSNVEELAQYKDKSKFTWIDVSGLKDVDSVKRLGELYDIHPLTIEDILNTEQQPKVEIFDEYRFLTIKTIQQNMIDQISIIITKEVFITFQEIPGDSFGGIRKRILEDAGEIRRMGTDYLAYSVLDSVIDDYFLALGNLEETIEDFEERALETSDGSFIEEIQATKKYLLHIKRAISPLKNNMLIISHHGLLIKNDELKPYLQDLSEHLNHVISMLENHREWLSNIMEVNLSVLSHQMNKVMKVLATISTIFIPLTFIAGVYGMNFEFMPELGYEFGYFAVLGAMLIIAVVMILIFKKHRWF